MRAATAWAVRRWTPRAPFLNDRLAYRLNVAVEDKGSFRDHVRAQRQVVAPALTWKLSPDTVLEYTAEFLRHATPLDRGVVAVNNRLGAVPASRFLGEPADGDVTVTNQTHQLVLSHEWNPDWRSRVGLSYRETGMEGFSTEATALQANGRTLTRQRRYRDFQSDDVAVQAELQGNLRTGGLEHELLVGVESYRFSMDSVMLRVNPSAARRRMPSTSSTPCTARRSPRRGATPIRWRSSATPRCMCKTPSSWVSSGA